ncbi:MAG: PBP1A family penicillin-binding protein [Hyphomonadaceae bacterium]|nr:PBP1A family penicillin-binding protein [Hyphomonadaceae bacterium]
MDGKSPASAKPKPTPAAKAGSKQTAPKKKTPGLQRKATGKAKPKLSLRWRLIKYGLIALLVTMLGAGGTGYWYYRSLYTGMPDLPSTAELWTVKREPATEFRSLDGSLLAIRGPRYGRVVRMADLPPHVPQAFIAAEDKRFYVHDGADTTAIARAAWINWRTGRTVSGASTITQQLIKNLVLDPRQTIRRKAQEVRLARELEERLSKNEILELYLNRVYFGAGFYGLDAASTHYFGKPPAELSLAEAALLAALPQAPSRLALTGNLDDARQRQAYVLSEMADAGFIDVLQADLARKEEITLVEREGEDPQFGYVLDAAAQEMRALLPEDAPPDLVVTLTVEPKLQTQVQELVAATMAEQGPDQSASQAAAIVMRDDGRIAAMVGGVDYTTSEFNRATQARRQPGSAFKAVVYTAALNNGASPYDIRQDAPLRIDRWEPRNYTGIYLGPVTLAEAYAESLNTVAAQLTQEVGEETVVETARRLGIESDLNPVPSLALGTSGVTLEELTRAYGTFMKDGLRLEPFLIAKIEDTRGNVHFEHVEPSARRVIREDVSRNMTAMMVRTVENGTGGAARVAGWRVAGKTGTSQDWRDAWFVGYARPAVVGVWVGNDNDSAMRRVSGGGLPAELFSGIMGLTLAGEEARAPRGAERYVAISEAAEQRVTFYRTLAGAFATVSGRDVATLQPANAQQ